MESKEIKKKLFSLFLVAMLIVTLLPDNVGMAEAMTLKQPGSAKIKQKTGKLKSYKKKGKTYYSKYKYLEYSWKKVSGVSGYEVYRYGEASKQWYKVKTTSKKVTTYAIPEVDKGMTVQLKVRSYKNTGNGKIYSDFSPVKKYKSKKEYWLHGIQKPGKYNKKEKFWNAPKQKKGHYRFLSEYAFVIQNKYRAEKGVAPLTWNNDIYEMAKIRSKEISKKYDHTRPNGKGCDTVMLDYIKANRKNSIYLAELIKLHSCAENISADETSAVEAMKGWKKSSGHYANILSKDDAFGAISVYVDKYENYTWDSLFMMAYDPKKGQAAKIKQELNLTNYDNDKQVNLSTTTE